jgi:type VI secretion system secreted protein Hcp
MLASIEPAIGNDAATEEGSMADKYCFCKISGVKGQSTDDRHKDELDVHSWSLGVSQAATGGSTRGRASFSPLSLVVESCTATPTLIALCAEGKKLEKAVLTQCVAAGGASVDQLVITMEGVVITSYNISGSGSTERADTFTISYDKISVDHTPLDGKGTKGPTVKAGWDIEKNVKL